MAVNEGDIINQLNLGVSIDPITDVYGLIPEYLKFRENFTNTYTNLLVDVVADDEVLEDADEIKEQKKEQEKQKFAWESTIIVWCNSNRVASSC